MTIKTNRLLRGAMLVVPAAGLVSGASAGPVLLTGDAADSQSSAAIYAHLLDIQLDNVTNGQIGILAIGVDVGSPAADWILSVSAQLDTPQAIAFINGETITAFGLSGYALLFIPSPSDVTPGGITQDESDKLNARVADVADFLTAGGGVFGLTQGQLSDPYAYLGDFAPVTSVAVPPGGLCTKGEDFDNVTPTALGDLFGISASNLDGCCWHNVFATFPEALVSLASANEPNCTGINGNASVVTGFVELPEINFDPPAQTEAAGEPSIEAVGDLDGNGTIDVATAIPDENPENNGAVQIFLNQGVDAANEWQGLVALAPIPVGRDPSGVAIGLFNADAHLDLAVPNKADNTVSVLINTGNGDGTFLAPATYAAGGQSPSAIVANDLTDDGIVDLGVALEDDDALVILEGDGNGGFSIFGGGGGIALAGFSLFAGSNPTTLMNGDFDNNKDDDLAGAGGGTAAGPAPGAVFVLKGLGGGNYAPAVFYEVGINPVDVSSADLDGDGFLDIVAANFGDATVSVLFNQGDGTFAPAVSVSVGDNPKSVQAADVTDDQDPDLIVVATDPEIGPAVQVLANRLEAGSPAAGEPFGLPVAFSVGPNAEPNFVVSADMDGDGLADIITVNDDPEAESGGSATVLLNNPAPIDCPGDLNGDGFSNVGDLLELLGALGPCAGCPADLNGDDEVNVIDLLLLLGLWGPCPTEEACPFDLNGDGVVSGLDVAELVHHLGPCEDEDCPWDLDGDGFVGLLDLLLLLQNFGDCPS